MKPSRYSQPLALEDFFHMRATHLFKQSLTLTWCLVL